MKLFSFLFPLRTLRASRGATPPSFTNCKLQIFNDKFLFLAFTLLFLLLTPAILHAQVVRLPAVTPNDQNPPGQLVSHPDSPSNILQAPGQYDVAPPSNAAAESQLFLPGDDTPAEGQKLPPGVRNGVFQKIMFDAAWLAPGGADGLGSNDLQLQGVFALPCPKRETPLIITPGFAVHYLQGPQKVDLPSQLHEGYVQFRWMAQLTPQLGVDLAVTPGIYSDFQQESDKAFRLPAHAAAAWTLSETLKIAAGAAYLDMPTGSNVIPIGGLIWTPRPDLKFDILFPHPKLAIRHYWAENHGDDVQDWLYIAGEFGNDAWAIERADGQTDQVSIRDYRFIIGMERKVIGGLSSRFEVAYIFGRRIHYNSDTPNFYPTDTLMFRGGLNY